VSQHLRVLRTSGLVEERRDGRRRLYRLGSVRLAALRRYLDAFWDVRLANLRVKIEKAPGGDYGFAFDIGKANRLTGWEPALLVREKIPVLVENIRRGVTQPVSPPR